MEDNLILSSIIERWLAKAGYETLTAADEPAARQKMREHEVALVLADVRLPEGDGISLLEWNMRHGMNVPFVVMTEYASIADAVRAIRLGAKDYLPKPVYEEPLLNLLRGLLKLPVYVNGERKLLERRSAAMRETERMVRRVAPVECSVMILGPNGSGKESVAQTIHRYSLRRDKPFVAVNCGCIPSELGASEFFGCVKGAFTGAEKDAPGYFGAAEGGTLFLDEIGNMPLGMQATLLRVLQEKVYYAVGSRQIRRADVRILSATNEDMGQAIREGRFREDLYHRLAGFEIYQPPLAECPEDILPLADFFRRQYSEEIRMETEGFTEAARNALLAYSWPGNVRELSNRMRRAVLLADSPMLTCEGLGLAPSSVKVVYRKYGLSPEPGEERERISEMLDAYGGNVSRAARALGVSRVTLYKKMERYSLK